jgi:hypothetical protein
MVFSTTRARIPTGSVIIAGIGANQGKSWRTTLYAMYSP